MMAGRAQANEVSVRSPRARAVHHLMGRHKRGKFYTA
jgi:hypothetical protein